MSALDGYADVHRYDAAVLQWGRRDELVPCGLQPRDLEILAALWRHHFLTSAQIAALWWPDAVPQVPRRRITRLFRAGLVERFRPYLNRGSYKWTYTLTREGFLVARDGGAIPASARFTRRSVYDYRFVLHDLQLNAWAIAYRRVARDALLAWHGEEESLIEPPADPDRRDLRLPDGGRVEGLRVPRPSPLHPDAALEVLVSAEAGHTTFLVEFDRTQRPEKNYPKFRRYDSFLCDWWRDTGYADQPTAPHALFICQGGHHLRRFLEGADHQLTGTHTRAGQRPSEFAYPGRRRTLFASEPDMHRGDLRAYRLPRFPPGHPDRAAEPLEPEELSLPGGTDG